MEKRISIEIEGTTPLLMNRFRDVQIEGKSKKRTGAVEASDIKEKLYLLNNVPQIPSVYLKNCIVEASKQFKIRGKGKSTYSKLLGSSLIVEPEYSEILGDGYEVFRIAAVNPMTKGRIMVERPRFNKWSAVFTLLLLDDGVSVDTLQEITNHAGIYVGIGDWRPDKKGMFGKFRVVSFKETN